MTRRHELAAVLLFGLTLLGFAAGGSLAQEWPLKTIRAVVPLTAGSATDVVARIVLAQLSAQIGQPVIIENRPGAGNTIGMAAVAQAEADGYTLLINSSSHTIVPATFRNLPFDALRDLLPIVPLGAVPTVLIVSPSKGYKNLSDFVAAARSRSGGMNYATAGAGNFSHLATEVFRRSAKFEGVHVPSKGAPEAVTEVLADRLDFFFSPLTVALPFLQDGRLQALAVSGSQRASALPDVPTTAEAGFLDSEYNFWVGMFAPAKTPRSIVQLLSDQTLKAVQNAEVRSKLARLGIDPMPLPQDGFAKLVRDEVALNTMIAASAGLKIN